MEKSRLEYLLARYSETELSESELSELENWYDELNYDSNDLSLLIEKTGGNGNLEYKLFKDFEKRINEPIKFKRVKLIRWISAAVIFLVVSVGLISYLSSYNNNKINEVRSLSATIIPGGNKAILTLSTGEQVDLAAVANGQIFKTRGLEVVKTSEGELLYAKQLNQPREPGGMNTISTPRGGQYQIVLSDGSRVWLNAASSLKYPSLFNEKERIVELSGEAYFEVSKDSYRPFIVKTNEQVVKVLGTEFNVNAYLGEITKTTLLMGSVQIVPSFKSVNGLGHTVLLSPGQQAVSKNNKVYVNAIDTSNEIAWKEGFFSFENTPIKEVMRQIGRWYDIETEYQGNVDQITFGGTYSKDKDFHDLLKGLELTKLVTFKIEGRKVIVMK